jgi:uncharacterized protein YecE (DUF72 family)
MSRWNFTGVWTFDLEWRWFNAGILPLMAKVLIGTSGWSYPSWRGPFFPKTVTASNHLEFYARQFVTTELNGVFYKTPSLEAVGSWRKRTPKDFVFAWKASRFITHWKRLGPSSRSSLALLETRLRALEPRVGPILFQLPPRFVADKDRLNRFIRLLKSGRRYAFEFRHSSWFEPPILDLLHDHNVALCLSDHRDAPTPWEVTASFIYLRGHGPGGAYKGHYSEQSLRTWAKSIKEWKRRRRDVYVYFDNDQKAAAPADARRLMKMINVER